MSKQISVSGLSGDTLFNVYVGNTCNDTSGIFIGSIDTEVGSEPYLFNLPFVFQYSQSYCVQVYSDNGCLMCKCFTN